MWNWFDCHLKEKVIYFIDPCIYKKSYVSNSQEYWIYLVPEYSDYIECR